MSSRLKAVRFQFAGHEAHHDFRPADHGQGARRLQAGVLEQRGHDAHMAAPAQAAIVHGDEHLGVALPAQAASSLR